jgi:hypothetical protein
MSAKYCGCDDEAGWVCERHRREPDVVKYFCDRCEKEVESDRALNPVHLPSVEGFVREELSICDECLKALHRWRWIPKTSVA